MGYRGTVLFWLFAERKLSGVHLSLGFKNGAHSLNVHFPFCDEEYNFDVPHLDPRLANLNEIEYESYAGLKESFPETLDDLMRRFEIRGQEDLFVVTGWRYKEEQVLGAIDALKHKNLVAEETIIASEEDEKEYKNVPAWRRVPRVQNSGAGNDTTTPTNALAQRAAGNAEASVFDLPRNVQVGGQFASAAKLATIRHRERLKRSRSRTRFRRAVKRRCLDSRTAGAGCGGPSAPFERQ